MQKYPKVLIYLAAWKRPQITEICFMGIQRLKRLFPVEPFAVISEELMKPLCKKYGVDYLMHENWPLGRKKNFGLSCLKEKKFDYMLEIGSDDLLKNEIFDLYPWDREVMALRSFIMLDSTTGECRHLTDRDGKYGVGRAIRRDALEGMNWTLWHDQQNVGLDNRSSMGLAVNGYMEKRYPSLEPLAIDIKSEVNLWPWTKTGSEYPINKALKGLSYDEVNAITSLYATV